MEVAARVARVGSEVRREARCGQARTAAARETEEVVMAREVVVMARAAVARAAVVAVRELVGRRRRW